MAESFNLDDSDPLFLSIGVASGKDSVLAAFRERYTSVTRLTLKGGSNPSGHRPSSVCAEVQFGGPQPCEGPGALLCALLHGTSVQAKPVSLERGRKRTKWTKSCTSVASGERIVSLSLVN